MYLYKCIKFVFLDFPLRKVFRTLENLILYFVVGISRSCFGYYTQICEYMFK